VQANQEFPRILWSSKVCYCRIAQIFQKSESNLKILKWNKFHPDDQQIWTTVHNSVSEATLSPEFMHSCLNCVYKTPTPVPFPHPYESIPLNSLPVSLRSYFILFSFLCQGLQIVILLPVFASDVISLMTKSIFIQSLETFCVKMAIESLVLPPKWLTNIKLCCFSYRTPLVPVISFGETDVYDQVQNPEGSCLRRAQEFCRRVTGIAPVALLGRGLFQYSFGVVPQRRPVTTLGNVSVTWIWCVKILKKTFGSEKRFCSRISLASQTGRFGRHNFKKLNPICRVFSIGSEQFDRSGFHLRTIPVNKLM
jgi:hypothetical protein